MFPQHVSEEVSLCSSEVTAPVQAAFWQSLAIPAVGRAPRSAAAARRFREIEAAKSCQSLPELPRMRPMARAAASTSPSLSEPSSGMSFAIRAAASAGSALRLGLRRLSMARHPIDSAKEITIRLASTVHWRKPLQYELRGVLCTLLHKQSLTMVSPARLPSRRGAFLLRCLHGESRCGHAVRFPAWRRFLALDLLSSHSFTSSSYQARVFGPSLMPGGSLACR